MENMKRGDILDVVIEKVEGKGKAVARIGQFVVFVDKGIPGQTVRVQVKKKKERFAETVFLEVVREAKNAIIPKCPWFGRCGGCVWQNMSYSDQLNVKESIVRDALIHVAKVQDISVLQDILPSPKEWYYRNKIELSFGLNEEGKTDIGFRRKGSWTDILPIDVCCIFSEKFSSLISVLRQWIKDTGKEYYDMKKSSSGYFQYLMIRKTDNEDQWMFNIITRQGKLPLVEDLIRKLQSVLGKSLSSIYHTVNHGGVGYAHHGDKGSTLLYGNEKIYERISDLTFLLSPFSFFQTNTKGTQVLYDVIKKYADVKKGDVILDLYCGTGSIGQYVGYGMDVEVYGIEIVPQAITDAKENAKNNGILNCTYLCGDARVLLKEKLEEYKKLFGVCIVDPPRSGLAPKALQRSLDIGMDRFIYISCNPITFARDVQFIQEHSNYILSKVQPVDMFPQTSHVELVALFKK